MAEDEVNDAYVFYYDIEKKEAVDGYNSAHNPTDVLQAESRWLYAMNSKYDDMLVPPSKVGKWMLFLSQAEVNQVWKKIKEAIMEGHLWNSKVSTTDPTNLTYAIMIYTKDYNDVDDVINTLEYLERTGIKPANKIIKYKTDEQTRAGIYSGGKQRASIYDSATIKQKRRSQNDELSWRRRDGVSNLAPTTSNWRTSYNSRRN